MPVALGVNGGVLGSNNLPTATTFRGVFTPNEVARAIALGFWPVNKSQAVTGVAGTGALGTLTVGSNADPYFEYTTLLLPGNGTNGAQNNTFLDGSTNNFTITRNGNTTQGTFSPFSQTGWGNYFDGTGDYLTVPDNAAFTMGSGDWTFECWIFPTISANAVILGQYSGGLSTSGPLLYFNTSNNVVLYAYDVGAATTRSVSAAVTLNQWTHIAGVRDGNSAKLYINGTSSGTPATFSGGIPDSTVVMGIGARDNGTENFGGYISNARIVKGVAVYTGNFTPPTSPLAATQSAGTNISAITGTQTSLLTCQSNRFIDNSTNNFTITRNGDTKVVAFSPFNPTAIWSSATYGGSGYFDGSGDYLSVADNAAFDFGTGDYTVELWIYRNNTTGDMAVLDGRSGSTGYLLYLNASNKLIWYVNAGVITGSTTIGSSQWYHIAISRVGTAVKLFVNGVEDGSATNSTSTDSTGLAIGAKNTASSIVDFNGYISNVRLLKGTGYSTITVPTAPLTAITNTSLLLNFTNAGIYDATSKNDLETVGNAQISTTQSKWGGSSMAFDGTGDYLVGPTNTALNTFRTGPFTVEAWVYPTATKSASSIFDTLPINGTGTRANSYAFSISSSNKAQIFTNGVSYVSSGSISLNTWTHIAFVREGTGTNQTKIYINGVNDGTFTTTTNDTLGGLNVGVASDVPTNSSYMFQGYIQDLRITKGYARYTANFTAPTSAFPTL